MAPIYICLPLLAETLPPTEAKRSQLFRKVPENKIHLVLASIQWARFEFLIFSDLDFNLIFVTLLSNDNFFEVHSVISINPSDSDFENMQLRSRLWFEMKMLTPPQCVIGAQSRVAELGSLSSGAKMAMKIFVKRVFTIFASNASFLRSIANLQN